MDTAWLSPRLPAPRSTADRGHLDSAAPPTAIYRQRQLHNKNSYFNLYLHCRYLVPSPCQRSQHSDLDQRRRMCGLRRRLGLNQHLYDDKHMATRCPT
jgi:hypothetical protein